MRLSAPTMMAVTRLLQPRRLLLILVALNTPHSFCGPRTSEAHLIELNKIICNYLNLNAGMLVGYGNYCGIGGLNHLPPLDDVDG
ncbi:unnamed protein product [Protopolystoma xenopodis]|uniref:Uncharacterized protein n=1 Tax=Protopolystoma xenopodis TaxID=117903 RepID=A0A448WUV4_9PLAT|nr:unnamed protein product [Protopolystoma xenopodis]